MSRARYLAAIVGVGTILASLPSPASAQTADVAKQRVAELGARISREENNAAKLQSELKALSSLVAAEQGNLDEIQSNLNATNARVSATRKTLDELNAKMKTRARSLYKRGPLEFVGVVLQADSLRDFVGRYSYASQLAKRDENLVFGTRAQQGKLREVQAYQRQLQDRQETTVRSLRRRQDAIGDVFARQQVVLANLAKARSEALDLLAQLDSGLAGRLKRVAGRGMTISYGEWGEAFLKYIGAPVVRNNLIVMVAWEATEGTNATWNPLATTMGAEGATTYNSHGVKNYNSMEQGLDATLRTLRRPGHNYEAILDGLERGAEPMETGHAIQQSDWCRGCQEGGYVVGIIPAVEKYYDKYAGD
jgi:peptidoglycan hydrolase CwlO-like protein